MHQNPDYAISKHQSLEYNIPLYTHPVKEPAICVGHWDYKTGAFHKVLTESQKKRVDEGFLQPVYTAGMLLAKELSRELLDKTIIDQQNEIKVLREQLRWALIAKEDVGHNFNVVSLQLQQKAQEK